MSDPVERVAFATAVDGGLALGDPTGAHVLVTPTGLEHRAAETAGPARAFAWADVHSVQVDAPTSRSRRPGALALLVGAAAETIGLSWTPSLAAFTVTVDDGDGDVPLECDGYIGPGYWGPHLEALTSGLHLLVAHPETRGVLADPSRALTDLDAAADAPPEEVARRLAEAWRAPGAGEG